MATTPNGADSLGSVRDALFDVGRKATRLADSVEQLEALYDRLYPELSDSLRKDPPTGYFYVPTGLDGTWGRTLEPGWTDDAPKRERRPRREAIEATLALRAAADSAMEAVAGVAPYMDSEAQSVDQRWTTRTIGHLRELRDAIVRGNGADACPSALPVIQTGVPDALRELARRVLQRMEEVKSAIVAGVQPRNPTVSVSPDLLDQLQRAAAVNPGAINRVAELAATKVARAFSGGKNGAPKPQNPPEGAEANHKIEPSPDAFLSEADVAKTAGVKRDTLRKHLPEFRRSHNNNDWHKVEHPRPRDPRYMYRWGSIKTLAESLRRTANVPANEKCSQKAR